MKLFTINFKLFLLFAFFTSVSEVLAQRRLDVFVMAQVNHAVINNMTASGLYSGTGYVLPTGETGIDISSGRHSNIIGYMPLQVRQVFFADQMGRERQTLHEHFKKFYYQHTFRIIADTARHTFLFAGPRLYLGVRKQQKSHNWMYSDDEIDDAGLGVNIMLKKQFRKISLRVSAGFDLGLSDLYSPHGYMYTRRDGLTQNINVLYLSFGLGYTVWH